MAQNNEKEDYKMKMYEAQAMVIEKEEEMDKMRREMDELRRRLGEQRRNDSLASNAEDTLPMGAASISSVSVRFSSIEDQVANAVAVITQNIVSLQKSVRELSARGEETARNWRISMENSDRRNREATREVRDELGELEAKIETKVETLKNEMNDKIQNERKEQEILYQSMKNLITESNEVLNNKIDLISRKIDGMEGEASKLKSKVYPPQILVVGGRDGKDRSSDIFLLDYSGKRCKKVSIELPEEISGHGTVILEDELYIIGGFLSSTVYRLNKKMKWEKLADMHERRDGITNSCISHNGCIWVIGGGIGSTPLNTIEKYDPATDRWERKPAMKRQRQGAAAAVINDRIYVCGGFNREGTVDTVEVFDISSEVWTGFCTLPQPRRNMSIIVDGTNIVLIGGSNEKTVWKMDVEGGNKEWIHLPPLNEGRFHSSAVMIETGCILVIGGEINNRSSSLVAIFSGQKWESFPPLPQPRAFHTSVVLTPAMVDAFRPFVLGV